MATGWAVNALLQAIPVQKADSAIIEAPDDQPDWVRVALNGSASDLKRLLDAGMKADAKTAGGSTALMMAARDPEKVKLLLACGADVNMPAETGITPLM